MRAKMTWMLMMGMGLVIGMSVGCQKPKPEEPITQAPEPTPPPFPESSVPAPEQQPVKPPVTADGMGWSLVLDDPVTGTYRSSSAIGGSPANDDPPGTIPGVLITELLTHTDPPQIDTIELHNPTGQAVDLGEYADEDVHGRDPPCWRRHRSDG